MANVPARNPCADERCIHRGLDRPRVIAVGERGQEVQEQSVGSGKHEQDPDPHAGEGLHAANSRVLTDRGRAVGDRTSARPRPCDGGHGVIALGEHDYLSLLGAQGPDCACAPMTPATPGSSRRAV